MRLDNKNRTIYSVLILICVIGFWLFENFYTPGTYSAGKNPLKEANFPAALMPSTTTDDVVHHSFFSLSYKEHFEQAEWVVYVLSKKHLTYDDRKRPYFIEDPWVKSKSADWRNYKGSGYDRGHLVPAGDRRFSEQAYNETFYTSNISPQDREFNAGVWNRLEMKIRYWAKKYGELYVITGGVLEDGLYEIGDEDVAVPDYFYKIVAKGSPDKLEVIGFLFPNKEQTKPLSSFAVSIDELESRTGIDFFKGLPEKKQAAVEAKVRVKNWKF